MENPLLNYSEQTHTISSTNMPTSEVVDVEEGQVHSAMKKYNVKAHKSNPLILSKGSSEKISMTKFLS
jgi:hypothetical protein